MLEFISDSLSSFTIEEVLSFCLFIGLSALSIFGARSAYYLGVNDGYGYSRESDNPGFRKAGIHLFKHCAWRWPELKDKLNPFSNRDEDSNYYIDTPQTKFADSITKEKKRQ